MGYIEIVGKNRQLNFGDFVIVVANNYFGAVSDVKWSAGPGSLGGQDYHQLTATEMPGHQHYNSPDGQGHSFIWGFNA